MLVIQSIYLNQYKFIYKVNEFFMNQSQPSLCWISQHRGSGNTNGSDFNCMTFWNTIYTDLNKISLFTYMAWLQFYLKCLWFLQAFLFWLTIWELLYRPLIISIYKVNQNIPKATWLIHKQQICVFWVLGIREKLQFLVEKQWCFLSYNFISTWKTPWKASNRCLLALKLICICKWSPL